jgi:hypothetical protein
MDAFIFQIIQNILDNLKMVLFKEKVHFMKVKYWYNKVNGKKESLLEKIIEEMINYFYCVYNIKMIAYII